MLSHRSILAAILAKAATHICTHAHAHALQACIMIGSLLPSVRMNFGATRTQLLTRSRCFNVGSGFFPPVPSGAGVKPWVAPPAVHVPVCSEQHLPAHPGCRVSTMCTPALCLWLHFPPGCCLSASSSLPHMLSLEEGSSAWNIRYAN